MKPPKISREAWLLAAMTLLAIAFKGFLLWQRSAYIDPDEGYYLLLARNVVTGHGYTLNGLPNIIFPPLLPLLISLFYLVFHNLQLSLGFITAVSGGLLGIVVYKICRVRFSPRDSLAGAFLGLFIFHLNALIPLNRPYVFTLYRGSDIFNVLLVCTVLLLAIRLVQTTRLRYALGTGVVCALAYLTRPEGFLLWLAVIAGLILMVSVRMIRLPVKLILAPVVAFLICSAPYMVYLKSVTGHWMLSGKVAAGQDYRQALLQVIKRGDWRDFNKVHYALDAARLEMNDQYFGYHPAGLGNDREASPALKNVWENLSLYPVVPRTLFSYPLVLLFAIGFVGGILEIVKRRSAPDAILALAFLYSLALAALSYPMPRHHLFLVPIFCVYSLWGIKLLLSLFMKKLSPTISVAVVLAVVVFSFATDYIRDFDDAAVTSAAFHRGRQVDEAVSAYLKARGARVLMSMQPGFAVRAFSDWQVLPSTDFTTLMAFAKKKKVDYVIWPDQWTYHFRVIEMSGSVLPSPGQPKFHFRTVEARDGFDLIRLTGAADGD